MRMVDEFRPSKYKETEFDSSVATLQRIDELIKLLHKSALNDVVGRNNNEIYVNCLDRIYMESKNKMTKEELQTAIEHQNKLADVIKNCGDKLRRPTEFPNDFINGWNEIKVKARDYEIFLMSTMDRHNMLLKDSKDAMTRFRTG